MENLSDKRDIILARERKFAAGIARDVLNKPKLSSWMIFIPFLFIFYIQDLMRFKKKRKEFLDNYIFSREKALNEAMAALRENRKPDAVALARKADLQDRATEKYAELLDVLIGHYTSLLKANGDDYETLVRFAYGKQRTNFLRFMNQLNNAEKTLNKALLPALRMAREGVNDVVEKIETRSDELRLVLIEEIFGAGS